MRVPRLGTMERVEKVLRMGRMVSDTKGTQASPALVHPIQVRTLSQRLLHRMSRLGLGPNGRGGTRRLLIYPADPVAVYKALSSIARCSLPSPLRASSSLVPRMPTPPPQPQLRFDRSAISASLLSSPCPGRLPLLLRIDDAIPPSFPPLPAPSRYISLLHLRSSALLEARHAECTDAFLRAIAAGNKSQVQPDAPTPRAGGRVNAKEGEGDQAHCPFSSLVR
ncbi:hypothetical protein BDZ90DRAFT_129613 [Jaminaea rosea]|uniref:Uncharacterized protein n=1 Tax=Jaminaea rosea TaxID=1569628 RepID=A0A316UTW9_9BASI|nr:hypothetical protein BDZ90DRAFT_129613 [Jaminaea rosea]PWN28746.1 hypothetical protein BDZ90DRAFT_129613 [Jaminaea rosea]